jgi:hypothetical protein
MPETSPFNATIMNWQTAANKGDKTSIQNLYNGSDAVALFTEGTDPDPSDPNKTPSAMIHGAAAIADDLAKHFGPGNPYQDIKLHELGWQQSADQTAGYSYGAWTAMVPDPSNPKSTVLQPGSWSVIWVQGSGNTPWLIQVHAAVPYVPNT